MVNTKYGAQSWKSLESWKLCRVAILWESHTLYTGTVIQSAAAAITHRVRLHPAMSFDPSCLKPSLFRTCAASRTGRPWVVKEVRLTIFFLETMFKSVHWWHRNIFLKLFQRFMTGWEKNCNRVHVAATMVISFQLWPLVILSSALWKTNVHEVEIKPLTILKISIKSALLRCSCKDHNPAE